MNYRSPFRLQIITRYPVLVIILFLYSIQASLSQDYYFDSYGVSDGLSSSKVYTIIQASNDYLWMGTESGVTRWDGSEFENFSSDDGLAIGGVRTIYEDHNGRIWIGHLNGGLTCYENNVFRIIDFDTLEIKGDITGITEHNNKLWITTSSGGALSAYYPEDEIRALKVKQYRGGQGLSDQVSGIYMDMDGILYCIADLGIKMYDAEEDKFVSYRPEGLTSYFNTIAMLEDSNGGRWFGTYHGGLYYFPPGDGEVIIYDARDGLANNWISCITEASTGQIWVGTWGGGITVFNDSEIITFNEKNGLPASEIHSIIEDHEGNMIITSQNNGIHVFKGYHFVNYPDDFFRDKNVWAINEDKHNRLWFGTNGGITLLDPEHDKLPLHYYPATHNISNQIRYIINDRDSNIWVGTNDNGVYSYHFGTNDFVYDYKLNDILVRTDLRVSAMAVDNENNLWIGTSDGVAVWNIDDEEGRRYTQYDGLAGNGISALYVDDGGRVWIGSERRNGLTVYEPGEQQFRIIELDNDLAPSCISETADGILWLGTMYQWWLALGDLYTAVMS